MDTIEKFFTLDMGVPQMAGSKGKTLDRALMATMCNFGAERQTKPGRGLAARAVKGKGKGK